MGFRLRESDALREIQSLDGKTYRIRKTAYGFGEEIAFYDENEKVIESFIPSEDYSHTEDIDEDDETEIVTVDGTVIKAQFLFSEWFEN